MKRMVKAVMALCSWVFSEKKSIFTVSKSKLAVYLLSALLVMTCHVAAPQPAAAEQDEEPAVSGTESKEAVPSGTETEAERSKVYMKIGDVTVTGSADYLTTADAAASVDVIGADQIEMENVDFSMELMKKVPGTYFGDWNQGVVSGTFSMRGFDANHDVPATLIVDGIPHNFGYGRMDMQPFFPLEIERIELVKGTADPRYGLQNIAGNVNIRTKRGGNFTQTRLLTGSYNTYDAGVITGDDDGKFSQTYFVGYRQSDGYRDHSDLKKGAASGKWFYSTDDKRLSIGAIGRIFGMDANAPGYITKEQAANDPRQAASFARTDGGKQEDQHISMHIDYLFTDQLAWSFKTYYQHIERIRWCRWSDTGSQQERLSDDDQYGAISTLTYETQDWGISRLKIDWGLDYQHQDNLEQRWVTEDRVRQGGPSRDWDASKYYWGSYLQADGDLTNWLRLVAGIRVDSFDGEMTNRNANVSSDMIDMDYIWQPKVGAIVTPVEGYNLYGNYGRTFQTASMPTLYGQDGSGNPISRDLEYSKNDGWEVGIKASPVNWFSARIDYWEMVATDEIRDKKDGSGDYINAGETERKGWDLSLSVRPHDWVALWGSYSGIEATYTDPGPGLESRTGKTIENIPDYAAKAGIDFTHPIGLFSNLWIEIQGDYEIDPENLVERDGAYTVWNWMIGQQWKRFTFGFEVKNLLDEKYNSFIWNSESGYSPGDARSYYAWVSLAY